MDHKTKMERNIDHVLGLLDNIPDGEDLPPPERTQMEVVEYEPVKTNIILADEASGEELDRLEDYNFSRTVIRRIIEKGMSALELSMLLAKESENPRAFDTIIQLIGTISKANGDLMKLHDSKKPAKESPNQTATTINNNTQNITVTKPEQTNEKCINDILDSLDDIKE